MPSGLGIAVRRGGSAWNDVEDNDFGIDEFMIFCRQVHTEPLVVVNIGLGSVEEAAEEVEYAERPSYQPLGPRAEGPSRRPIA